MIILIRQAGLSPRCVTNLNPLRNRILNEVLVPILHLNPNANGAEFCVEECGNLNSPPLGEDPFCYVRLVDVSVLNRSPEAFAEARQRIEDIYASVIARFQKDDSVDLSVRIVLDGPINGSNLVEAPETRRVLIEKSE